MTWTLSDSPDDFLAAAGEFLAADPAENTVLLSIAARLAAGTPTGGDPALPPSLGWWRPAAGAPVGGAFVRMPAQPLRLSRMPREAAARLAETLSAEELPGVTGVVEAAEAFAGAWTARSAQDVRVHRNERLYRLGELTPPTVDGRLRPAGPPDLELLTGWVLAFVEEAEVAPGDVVRIVERRISTGDLCVWERDGRPVSMAGVSPVVAGMARIGPVYTPPEERGRGFGGAVTAGISELALERGATQVVLFTDLSNPTSNSLYQRLGYRAVGDQVVLDFTG